MGVLPGIGGIIAARDDSLPSILRSFGLESGLKLLLDAGDSNSYTGGQVWQDISGGGFDFRLGSGDTVDSYDPTFNGSVGGLSGGDFFSFDGGDRFGPVGSNQAWVSELHKNNAVFTLMAWVWLGTIGTKYNSLMGTNDDTSSTAGISWQATNGAGKPRFLVVSNGVDLDVSSTLSPTLNVWQFHTLTMDEASGLLTFGLNGTYDAKTGQTYANPSSNSATFGLGLGANADKRDSPRNLQSGGRMAVVGAWQGVALGQAEITEIFNATRNRFGV